MFGGSDYAEDVLFFMALIVSLNDHLAERWGSVGTDRQSICGKPIPDVMLENPKILAVESSVSRNQCLACRILISSIPSSRVFSFGLVPLP